MSFNSYGAKKDLVMAFPEFPPYAYFSNGKAKGKCVDLVKTKLGSKYNLIFKSFPWPRVISNLKSGEIDSIGCLSFSAKRKSFSIYSDPIFKINILALKKRGNLVKINTIEDLKKYEGVVVRGDKASEYFSSNSLHQVSSVKSFLQFIILGRATVGILPEEVYNEGLASFSNLEQSQLNSRVLFREDIYLVISKKSIFKNDIKEINNLLNR